jgi:hypothetical protein
MMTSLTRNHDTAPPDDEDQDEHFTPYAVSIVSDLHSFQYLRMKLIFLPIIYPTAVMPIVMPVIATMVNVLYLSLVLVLLLLLLLAGESEYDDDVTTLPQDMMMNNE